MHIHAAIDSLNLVINCVQLWLAGAIAQEKWSWRVLRSSCWTVLRACTDAYMNCVAERQIILSLTTCLLTANIHWDSKISYQYCSLTFYLRLDKEQLPLLIQQTDITTDLVNDECVVTDGNMLYSIRTLPRLCLVHTADSYENEGQFSCDQVIIWMCFMSVGKTTFSV